jgi:hypothetical protein
MGEPIDAILWIHVGTVGDLLRSLLRRLVTFQMILQIGVWGFLFPIGMVLGLSK